MEIFTFILDCGMEMQKRQLMNIEDVMQPGKLQMIASSLERIRIFVTLACMLMITLLTT